MRSSPGVCVCVRVSIVHKVDKKESQGATRALALGHTEKMDLIYIQDRALERRRRGETSFLRA